MERTPNPKKGKEMGKNEIRRLEDRIRGHESHALLGRGYLPEEGERKKPRHP